MPAESVEGILYDLTVSASSLPQSLALLCLFLGKMCGHLPIVKCLLSLRGHTAERTGFAMLVTTHWEASHSA